MTILILWFLVMYGLLSKDKWDLLSNPNPYHNLNNGHCKYGLKKARKIY